MKILIAGGAGFIANTLIKKLLKENHEIHVLDNLSTGNYANIEELIKERKIKFYKHDISEPLPKKILKIKFDQIYNLASPATPKYFEINPIGIIEANVYGVHNLLKLALKCKARFLQTSTSEVYGSALQSPQNEEYWGNVNPNGPRSPYDEGKRCAEALIYSFKRVYNLDVRVVRIFNTYGPYMRQDDGRVVSNFIIQALTGKDLTIYGNGKFTRSFCFVEDLVRGITKLMNIKDCVEGPVNIGNDREFTIQELAEMILRITKSKSKIVYLDKVKDDPPQRRPDLTKALNLLNYKPETMLEEGLKKTIEYFKEVL